MVTERVKIRAHHGMCLTFFEGKGYSEAFTRQMQRISDTMKGNPMLQIVKRDDVICQKCPNLQGGLCKTEKLVQEYDRKVIKLCGLEENSEISWAEFSNLVKERIIAPGKRKDICQNCQWTKICESKEQEICP